ncbi:metalloregulator ArsR/SmtB family transcription factor [Tengunoibacter tsumagoiensis]|uniref:metalloregulator ArsR/SmtB family transcription factor n=1 Tax=Tengunoibacter tsumagoiensis TaxID=2014871 RepID=UPI000F828C99|nr:metalloregulator ArsR/SmtB family transcription factor [Tengunoibacter tsumagoiensis]
MIGTVSPPPILKLVAHEIRWAIIRELAHSDYRVQELVERLAFPQNLVSYHLRKLREGHLVSERRSSADEREVYYQLDLNHVQERYLAAGFLIHPAIAPSADHEGRQKSFSSASGARVLFLCTENSARSQMAEALLRHLSQGTIEAVSAGSQPADRIHPLARQVMEQQGIDMRQAVPKHLDLFEDQHFDAIITVCDRVVESCPDMVCGHEPIHWSLADPAAVQGTDADRLTAFEQTAEHLSTRLHFFLPVLDLAQRSRNAQ